MTKCKGLTKDGKPCGAYAMVNGYCYRHNPDISQTVKLMASRRGGESLCKAVLEEKIDIYTLSGLKALLVANIEDLRAGRVSPRFANAVSQAVAPLVSLYAYSDLEARVKALEEGV